jgi:hypothetical protein
VALAAYRIISYVTSSCKSISDDAFRKRES